MILRNIIQCIHCEDVIESRHRHDFQWCKWKTVAVDGGKDYLKRSFSKDGDYIDMSESDEVESEE